MKKQLFFKLIAVFLLFSFSPFLFLSSKVRAGAGDNISGFAWSENIGWVSFNNTSGGGPTDYGVNMDGNTGVLSGYAWSEHIGWISFNRADTGAPPEPPDYGTYLASINLITREVTGWARVLNYGNGWDGWIKLNGVSVNKNVSPAEFRGFAWSDVVIGWLSFNRENCDANKDGLSDGVPAGCPLAGTVISDYKVVTSFSFNDPPVVTPNNPVQGNYCGLLDPPVFLSWNYSDPENDPQASYQVQIDNDSDFSSIELDSCQPPLDTCAPGNYSNTFAPMDLAYNTTFYWRLKVWDDQNSVSDWAYNLGYPSFSFATDEHRWPNVSNITSQPQVPRVDQNAIFSAQVTVYDGVNNPNYDWTFQSSNPLSSFAQNPIVQFNSPGIKDVSLTVTDNDGFFCPAETTVTVQQVAPSPEWKEIPPISWIKNILENILAFLKDSLQLASK